MFAIGTENEEHVMADKRPAAYWEQGPDGSEHAVFRASALGTQCEASLVRALVGQPGEGPSKMMQEKFDQGSAGEAELMGLLESKHGWKLYGADKLSYWGPVQDDGQIETELKVGNHVVRCHPDGVGFRTDQMGRDEDKAPDWATIGAIAVVEGKLFAESTYKRWLSEGLDVIAGYAWQVSVEMLTTGLPCVYVVGVKDKDGNVQADRTYVRFYDTPPVSRVEIAKKVMRVVGAARDHEAGRPMMPCVEGGQYPCPYYRMSDTECGKKAPRATVDEAEDPDLAAKIAHWARFYLTGETIRKSGQHKMDQAKQELLELVDESTDLGPYRITRSGGGDGKVSWKGVAQELAEEMNMEPDEWAGRQEKYKGEPGKASVTVKLIEEET